MASFTKNRSGNWEVRVRRKGWPTQTSTFTTKRKAQDWAHKIETQLAESNFVDRSAAHRTTLKNLIELYLTEVTDKRPGETSRVAERSRLERFMREEKKICSFALINLTPEHFEDYRNRRLQQPSPSGKDKTIAPGTVKRELTILKRVIDYRLRRLGLNSNPVNTFDVTRPIVKDERNVRLTQDEIDRLLFACGKSRNPWLLPFVQIGFLTGARRGSLLSLKWEDIDLNDHTAILRGVKNSRSPEEIIDHSVTLSPEATDILLILPHSLDGRVFPMTANAFRLAFERARKRAGVEHFHFHDTRHELVSSLYEDGWSDVEVMAITGHKDPKSVKRYATLKKDHLFEKLSTRRSAKKYKGQT